MKLNWTLVHQMRGNYCTCGRSSCGLLSGRGEPEERRSHSQLLVVILWWSRVSLHKTPWNLLHLGLLGHLSLLVSPMEVEWLSDWCLATPSRFRARKLCKMSYLRVLSGLIKNILFVNYIPSLGNPDYFVQNHLQICTVVLWYSNVKQTNKYINALMK